MAEFLMIRRPYYIRPASFLGQTTRNDELLNMARAFIDLADTDVPAIAFDREIFEVAISTMEL
jgi:hypothetical protein